VTFVVPNAVDSLQMREIFDEAILQTQFSGDDETEGQVKEDLVPHLSLLGAIQKKWTKEERKQKVCPLCRKDNSKVDCKCE